MRLHVLGRPKVMVHAEPADLPLGKPLAVLIYVVLSGHDPTREELARMFWPDSTGTRARTSVRQALWTIRKALGREDICRDDPLELPPELGCDLHELHAAIQSEDGRKLESLWASPFSGLLLSDAPLWNDWVERQRGDLERRTAGALAAAAARAIADGRSELGIRHLETAIELVPYVDAYLIQLCEEYIAARRFDEVVSLVGRNRNIFAGDSSVEARLDSLEARVRAAQHAIATDVDGPIALEFVGRSEEYGTLLRNWKRARTIRPGISLVAGPAGIGKTRLLRETIRAVEPDGPVVYVKCSEIPARYGMVAEITRHLLRLRGAAGISAAAERILHQLTPSLADHEIGQGNTLAAAGLTDALRDLIEAVAEEQPVLLVIDDFHWCDLPSRRLLSRIWFQLKEPGSFFILAYREEETDREAAEIVALLERDLNADRIDLGTLSIAELRETISLSFRVEAEKSLEQAIRKLSGFTDGNPLFLVEVLKSLAEMGAVRREGTEWVLMASSLPEDLPLPPTVESILAQRLDTVSADASAVAHMVAEHDTAPSVEAIRHGLGWSNSRLSLAVEELQEAKVLRMDQAGRLSFLHDLLRRRSTDRGTSDSSIPRKTLMFAVVALTLLISGYLALVQQDIPPSYGNGRILLRSPGDSLLELRPAGPAPAEWPVQVSEVRSPYGMAGYWQGVKGPFRTTSNRVLWMQHIGGDSGYAIRMLEYKGSNWVADTLTVFGVSEGYLSPDARFLVYNERVEGGHEIFLQDVEKQQQPRSLLRSTGDVHLAGWSSDGRLIAYVQHGPTEDSLMLITPAGRRIDAMGVGSASYTAWCGNRDDAIALTTIEWRQGRQIFVLRILRRDGDSLRLAAELEDLMRVDFVCSPDGSAIVYYRSVRGEPLLMLHDLAADTTHTLPVAVRDGQWLVGWLPDELSPVPSVVAASPDSLSLAWGGRVSLSAHAQMSDGSIMKEGIEWRSADPTIASVTSTGIVTGNRLGSAEIVAVRDDWLSDTIQVAVHGSSNPNAILHATFNEALDPAVWSLPPHSDLGHVQAMDGVLSLQGQEANSIKLQIPQPLPRGGTLQFEFRIPESSTIENTYVMTYLSSMARPESASSGEDWRRKELAGFLYPCHIDELYTPRQIGFFSDYTLMRCYDVPEDFDPSQWNHIALQIRADGLVRWYLNRELIAESPVRMSNDLEAVWRPEIFGGGRGDSRLEIRNLSLWSEPRF